MPDQVKSAVPQYLGMAFAQNLIGFLFAFFLEKGELSYPKTIELKGAAFATVLYLLMLYFFMFRQALSKFVNQQLYVAIGQKDTIIVEFFENTNRTFENALEQMPLFMPCFLLYTFLVNPGRGGMLGFLYCFFMALYPCLKEQGGALGISTVPRYLMNHFMIWGVIMAALGTGGAPPAPPAPSFSPGRGDVYSNSKYLADLMHGMTVEKCMHYCENWESTCKDICKKEKQCNLHDEVDARHYTRDTSCSKTCKGFNMHRGHHCTLFSDNVKLLHGGRGQFYNRAGFTPKGEGDHDD